MSHFLSMLGQELSDLLSFFVTIALLQNVVLTVGFGSSATIHMVRKPKNIWLFSALLTVFIVLTVLIAYPLDRLFGTSINNVWRPIMMLSITSLLYVIATILMRKYKPALYTRAAGMMPMAAFNNLVLGIALISNTHFSANLGSIIGLAVGSSLSFAIITWLTVEGVERMDNPDMPDSFRGMPSTLVYLGLVALALMGFTSDFTLI